MWQLKNGHGGRRAGGKRGGGADAGNEAYEGEGSRRRQHGQSPFRQLRRKGMIPSTETGEGDVRE